MKAAVLLFTLLIAFASVPLSGSVFVSIADELPATLPPGTAYTAKSTGGPWHLASTWVQGAVPGPGSVVTIPAGVTVRIEHLENSAANAPKWVRVQGRLEVSNTVSTRRTRFRTGRREGRSRRSDKPRARRRRARYFSYFARNASITERNRAGSSYHGRCPLRSKITSSEPGMAC